MTTRMTVTGVSVCPTGEEDTSISHPLSPAGRRSGFANTTTDTRTANCSPASLRLWRSAAADGTSGYSVKWIRRRNDDSGNDITADRRQTIRRYDGKPRFHGLGGWGSHEPLPQQDLCQSSNHNARQGDGHLSDAVLPHDGQQTFRGQDERHRSLRGRLLRYVGGDLHLRNGTLHEILIINELKL